MILLFVLLFGWFLTAMWFLRRRHQLREKLGPVYFVLVGIVLGGLPLDAVLHFIPGTIWFLDLPQELTLSKRLERYREDPKYKGTWRMRHADFVCERILNPFDPSGHHC